jgi:hypothetical protein
MGIDEEHHNLIGRLIEHARGNAVVGLWDDVFHQLRGLCLLAAAEDKARARGGALTENLVFNRDILRDLFQQVTTASARNVEPGSENEDLQEAVRNGAESARQEIIDRTGGRLLLMKEAERAALRKVLVEIWDDFDDERRK